MESIQVVFVIIAIPVSCKCGGNIIYGALISELIKTLANMFRYIEFITLEDKALVKYYIMES